MLPGSKSAAEATNDAKDIVMRPEKQMKKAHKNGKQEMAGKMKKAHTY